MTVVLIVEDEFLQREYLRTALDDAGYTAVEAANADEAIAILEGREDIRLVITDINMPGSIDGMKLAAAVRERWPPIPIIVTTGRERPPAGLMPTNSRFICKPYASAQMLTVMHELQVNGNP